MCRSVWVMFHTNGYISLFHPFHTPKKISSVGFRDLMEGYKAHTYKEHFEGNVWPINKFGLPLIKIISFFTSWLFPYFKFYSSGHFRLERKWGVEKEKRKLNPFFLALHHTLKYTHSILRMHVAAHGTTPKNRIFHCRIFSHKSLLIFGHFFPLSGFFFSI